jgi:polyphosphate glucokinase
MTLAIDVGGSGLKAAVLDARGRMASDRVRTCTPPGCTPRALVSELARLTRDLPTFDRVSVGFPGVVRHGRIVTAPNLGTERFSGFDLAGALEKSLGRPTRVMNDADVQGYGAIHGRGVEMVLTLGTGFGTALFSDGMIGPHLELAHHPFRKGRTYEEELGNAARRRSGNRAWSRRVWKAVETLRRLVHFDHLHLGGGNASKLKGKLPPGVRIVPNTSGILGGIRLWHETSGSSRIRAVT